MEAQMDGIPFLSVTVKLGSFWPLMERRSAVPKNALAYSEQQSSL